MSAKDPKDLSRLFAERVNRGDLDGLTELYEQGAKFIAAGGSEADGRAAIRGSLEGLLALGPRITSSDGRAVRAGDLALISSRWRMTFAGSEGATADAQRDERRDLRGCEAGAASPEGVEAGAASFEGVEAGATSFAGVEAGAASFEGVSTEVARRQCDGSWLYLIDDPSSATLHP